MSNANTPIDDDLLVKYLIGEVTPAEYVQVEEWIAASDANRKHYVDFKLIWDQNQEAATNNNMDKDAAHTRLQNRVKNTSAPKYAVQVKKINYKYWISLAALVVLICTVLWLTFNHFYDNGSVSFVKIESKNKMRTQTLPDGSVITLNSRSTIVYPAKFNGRFRPVSLRGEAFFKVTPNNTKPFIIEVNDVVIKAIGTSFNVKSRNGKTEVAVETGIVKVTKKQNSVDLNPGEMVTITPQQDQLLKQPSKGKLYNYYLTRQLVCNQTPLIELVQTLNQVDGTHIAIANKSLDSLPITATFQNQSLDEILTMVSDTFKIKVERNGKQIILN
jgi:ferric-dicitrate binding protein FerR (iron transport regulator)